MPALTPGSVDRRRRMRMMGAARRRILAPALVLVAVGLAACGSDSPGADSAASIAETAQTATASARSHVVVVVMENKERGRVLGRPEAPYFNGLARRAGLAANSYGVRHPSLPNYLALISGSTQGITD